MRHQAITRVVDARASQDRVILWLACKHTKSLSPHEPELICGIDHLKVGDHVLCHHCPDPPPPEKTPHQLWKEAGEP